ncbi:MAG: type II secretion system protein GspG [Alicyclobacillus sp.]|nr:type II secretion system protein GspG [Alicyclobacillus sp.]
MSWVGGTRGLKTFAERILRLFSLQRPLPRPTNDEGLTLIELIAVITILGIIAGIGIPMVEGSIKNSKINTTEQNMMIIAEALNRYAVEHDGNYPTASTFTSASTALSSLVNSSNPSQGYLQAVPKDAWGNDFNYEASNANGPFYLETTSSSGATLYYSSTMSGPQTTQPTGWPSS